MKQLEGIKQEIQHLLIAIDTSKRISSQIIENIRKNLTNYLNSLSVKDSKYRLVFFDRSSIKDTRTSSFLLAMSDYLNKESNGGQMPDFRNRPPLIVYLSDKTTQFPFFKIQLNQLRNRWWFRASNKFGIAIGDNPNTSIMLRTIVTNKGKILRTNLYELDSLLNMIVKMTFVNKNQTRKCLDSYLFISEGGT